MSTFFGCTVKRAARLPLLAVAMATALSGALVAVGTADAAFAGSASSQYGTIGAPDGVLPARHQCGTYTYSYALTPPEGNWALETFITDPRGNTVASGAVLEGYSPGGTAASLTYTLCRNGTRQGLFTLRGKFSFADARGNVTNAEMTPATFTMVNAPKQRTHQASNASKNRQGKKHKKHGHKKHGHQHRHGDRSR